MNIQYENTITALDNLTRTQTRYIGQCPVCGSYNLERLAQTNLTEKRACVDCHYFFGVVRVIGGIIPPWYISRGEW